MQILRKKSAMDEHIEPSKAYIKRQHAQKKHHPLFKIKAHGKRVLSAPIRGKIRMYRNLLEKY